MAELLTTAVLAVTALYVSGIGDAALEVTTLIFVGTLIAGVLLASAWRPLLRLRLLEIAVPVFQAVWVAAFARAHELAAAPDAFYLYLVVVIGAAASTTRGLELGAGATCLIYAASPFVGSAESRPAVAAVALPALLLAAFATVASVHSRRASAAQRLSEVRWQRAKLLRRERERIERRRRRSVLEVETERRRLYDGLARERAVIRRLCAELDKPIHRLRAELDQLALVGVDGTAKNDLLEVMRRQTGRMRTVRSRLQRVVAEPEPAERPGPEADGLDAMPILELLAHAAAFDAAAYGIGFDLELPESLPRLGLAEAELKRGVFDMINDGLRRTPRGGVVVLSAAHQHGEVQISLSCSREPVRESRGRGGATPDAMLWWRHDIQMDDDRGLDMARELLATDGIEVLRDDHETRYRLQLPTDVRRGSVIAGWQPVFDGDVQPLVLPQPANAIPVSEVA